MGFGPLLPRGKVGPLGREKMTAHQRRLPMLPKTRSISKSWKTRYHLAALAIGSVPLQGIIMGCIAFPIPWMADIMNYITFSVPWMVIITQYIFLLLPRVGCTIHYNAWRSSSGGMQSLPNTYHVLNIWLHCLLSRYFLEASGYITLCVSPQVATFISAPRILATLGDGGSTIKHSVVRKSHT